MLEDKSVKLFKASSAEGTGRPGQALGLDEKGRLKVGTGGGVLLISELQLEGKTRLPASEFTKGHRLERLEGTSRGPA
jgi:methionyl-tRNA formyltransferase